MTSLVGKHPKEKANAINIPYQSLIKTYPCPVEIPNPKRARKSKFIYGVHKALFG